MSHPNLRRLRPILQLLPHGTRNDHRAVPSEAAAQPMSASLDRGSTLIYCVVCIQAGCPTEATHQTRDMLCGCEQHIRELEQDGLAAVRRARLRAGFQSVRGSLR